LRHWAGTDRDNASAFERRGDFRAAVVNDSAEVSLDESTMGIDSSAEFSLVVATRADAGIDTGDIIVGKQGALTPGTPEFVMPGGLEVVQEPLADSITATAAVLRVTFRAQGADVTVSDFAYDQTGGGTVRPPATPITIPRGSEVAATFSVDPGSLVPGSFLTMRLAGVAARTSPGGARVVPTFSGSGGRAYVGPVPTSKVVDGLFDDWSMVQLLPTDPVPPSVDLRQSATSIQTDAFFYLETQGDVLAGAVLPEKRVPPGNGGGTSSSAVVAIKRTTGEDLLRIYVDTDDRDTVGQAIGGLVANRLLEVRGRLGRITSTAMFAWDTAGRDWAPTSGFTFDIAFVGSQFEASAQAGFFGTMNNPRVLFATTDWAGRGDATAATGLRSGTRSGPGIAPLHGPNPLTILATPLTNIPSIDGNCATTSTEYDAASTNTTADLTFQLGRWSDSQYLFVCLEVTADTTNNTLDWGELLFDTNHLGGSAPQPDDRRFQVASNSTNLTRQKGNGTAWVDCGTDCDAGDIAQGNYSGTDEIYEFRIRFSDVWGNNTPSDNQTAGFAIVAYDSDTATNYSWGNDNVDENVPDTWGHLEIPEFPSTLAMAAVTFGILGVVRRRRRGRAANP